MACDQTVAFDHQGGSKDRRTSLIALPAETLRHILTDVLLSERNPPASPSDSLDRTRLSTSTGVWIITRSLENPAVPLLLVNRLINQHVQAITATEKSLQNYTLDIMFNKMAGLWPTWTSVPVMTHHVHDLHATFRIFNPDPDLPSKFKKSGPLGAGNGGMHKGVWNFYYLLTSFLQNGPLARSAARPGRAKCQYTIRNLVIDVLAPPEGEDHTVTGPRVIESAGGQKSTVETFKLGSRCEGWQGPPNPEPRIEPAEKLGLFMHDWISTFLTLSFETDYATILFEGILDSIEIRVDGEVRYHIDIEDALPKTEPQFRPARERGQRERFRQWKDWVTEKRRLSRLERGPPGDRPHDLILYFHDL